MQGRESLGWGRTLAQWEEARRATITAREAIARRAPLGSGPRGLAENTAKNAYAMAEGTALLSPAIAAGIAIPPLGIGLGALGLAGLGAVIYDRAKQSGFRRGIQELAYENPLDAASIGLGLATGARAALKPRAELGAIVPNTLRLPRKRLSAVGAQAAQRRGTLIPARDVLPLEVALEEGGMPNRATTEQMQTLFMEGLHGMGSKPGILDDVIRQNPLVTKEWADIRTVPTVVNVEGEPQALVATPRRNRYGKITNTAGTSNPAEIEVTLNPVFSPERNMSQEAIALHEAVHARQATLQRAWDTRKYRTSKTVADYEQLWHERGPHSAERTFAVGISPKRNFGFTNKGKFKEVPQVTGRRVPMEQATNAGRVSPQLRDATVIRDESGRPKLYYQVMIDNVPHQSEGVLWSTADPEQASRFALTMLEQKGGSVADVTKIPQGLNIRQRTFSALRMLDTDKPFRPNDSLHMKLFNMLVESKAFPNTDPQKLAGIPVREIYRLAIGVARTIKIPEPERYVHDQLIKAGYDAISLNNGQTVGRLVHRWAPIIGKRNVTPMRVPQGTFATPKLQPALRYNGRVWAGGGTHGETWQAMPDDIRMSLENPALRGTTKNNPLESGFWNPETREFIPEDVAMSSATRWQRTYGSDMVPPREIK